MKKGLLLIFAIIMLSSLAAADNVTLFEPDGAMFTDTRNVTFKCNLSTLDTIGDVHLKLGTEGVLAKNQTINAGASDKNVTWEVKNLPNGTYNWNCEGELGNGSMIIGESNKTFTVKVAVEAELPPISNPTNLAPNLTEDIPTQSWKGNKNKTLNISEYFVDPDGDKLNFSAEEPSQHLTIYIDGDIVTLEPDKGWTGNESLKFYAYDGQFNVSSNDVLIVVQEVSAVNWSKLLNNKTKQASPPTIKSVGPAENPYTLDTGSGTFSVAAVDPDNGSLEYKWYLDGEVIADATNPNYIFSNPESGIYNLSVEVLGEENVSSSYSWSVVVMEEEPETVAAEEIVVEDAVPEPVCGDDKRDIGENCESCPEDVPCPEGYECKEKKCVKKSNLWILLAAFGGALVVFILAAGFVFKLIKREAEEKELLAEAPKIKPLSSVEGEKPAIPEEPPAEPAQEPQEQEKPAEPVQEQPAKPVQQPENPALKSFIEQMRARGHSNEEIKAKLIANGWTEEQIGISLD